MHSVFLQKMTDASVANRPNVRGLITVGIVTLFGFGCR